MRYLASFLYTVGLVVLLGIVSALLLNTPDWLLFAVAVVFSFCMLWALVDTLAFGD